MTFKYFKKVMMYSKIFLRLLKVYKNQSVFNYNFHRLYKSIPILKKPLTFTYIRLLINFNDFSSRSINAHASNFSCDFLKDLKRLFDQVKLSTVT